MNARFIIAGSGPSLKNFNPPAWASVIAVNQAINYLPRADYWFTLDPSKINLRTMQENKDGVEYYCAVDMGWYNGGGKKYIPDHVKILKRVRQVHASPKDKHSPMYNIHRLQARFRIDKRPGYISTGNSAWGALNLAYHLGAVKVLLIGIDANDDLKIDGTKSRTNMHHLPLLFSSAADQIDMVSCGKMKADKIPNKTLEQGLIWLKQ